MVIGNFDQLIYWDEGLESGLLACLQVPCTLEAQFMVMGSMGYWSIVMYGIWELGAYFGCRFSFYAFVHSVFCILKMI